jgi:hypothetical protein
VISVAAATSAAAKGIPAPIIDLTGKRIKRRPVLGGLINAYETA